MNILWVKAGGFLPLDSGGKIRSYNIVRQLARENSVSVFTFYPAVKNDVHARMASEVQQLVTFPLRLPAARSFKELAGYGTRLLSSLPFAFWKYCTPEVKSTVETLVANKSFDVIVCDFLVAAGVIPWNTPTPKVLFTHNVEAMIWKRHYEITRNPFWKLVSWREWRTTARLERRYLREADLVLTVSDTDSDIFAPIVGKENLVTIPTGVDTEFFRPSGEERPNEIVFTGSMDWMPNQDGMLYFLENIWPQVERDLPGAHLTIVGRNPPPSVKAAIKPGMNVSLTGWVPDVRPYLEAAGIVIVPLRVGSGTRLKIFEAMAMGKAVVSTTLGAEGLPVTAGANIEIADEPDDFAAKILELLRDRECRQRLGSNARNLVEAHYGWPIVTQTFMQALSAVVSSHRAAHQ